MKTRDSLLRIIKRTRNTFNEINLLTSKSLTFSSKPTLCSNGTQFHCKQFVNKFIQILHLKSYDSLRHKFYEILIGKSEEFIQ
jgi:hypothetical protein